jgi:hypothetical protein
LVIHFSLLFKICIIYVNLAVKIDNKHSNYFNLEKGVKQGVRLKPTLFNYFINDIYVHDIFDKSCDPLKRHKLYIFWIIMKNVWPILFVISLYNRPLQGSTLTVARLPGASETRLRASENGTQLALLGNWKLFCDMFNFGRENLIKDCRMICISYTNIV